MLAISCASHPLLFFALRQQWPMHLLPSTGAPRCLAPIISVCWLPIAQPTHLLLLRKVWHGLNSDSEVACLFCHCQCRFYPPWCCFSIMSGLLFFGVLMHFFPAATFHLVARHRFYWCPGEASSCQFTVVLLFVSYYFLLSCFSHLCIMFFILCCLLFVLFHVLDG